jgi:Lon protease-like protein
MVLFPGAIIPLHIFETRYRRMVADILEGEKRFGLIYHDPDESGPFMNEQGRIGTVAEIRKHHPLPDGRSLIMVRGGDRVEIRAEVKGDVPYYRAEVRACEDEPVADAEALVARRKRSLALFKNVLQTLPHVPDALPSFSVKKELSFRLAAVVRMDPFWQQELLEMRNELSRLDRLDPIFQAGIERWWADRGTEA